MTPQVRPARPEDVQVFLRLMLMSDKTFLPNVFGKDYERIIRTTFVSGEGLFGYPNVRLVEADGRVAGILLTYTYEQMAEAVAGFDSGSERPALLRLLTHLPGLLFHALFRRRSSEPRPSWVNPGEYYLANMAVFPEFRRQGLGRLLLVDAEAQARARGCARLALDVEAENRDAIRLYEQSGFVREERDLNLMGRFSFQRFSRPVGG